MEAQALLIIILVIITADFLFEQLLDYLNLKHQKPKLPDELKDIYDEEKYRKSVAYNKTRARFSFFTDGLSFVIYFILIALGIFGFVDGWLREFFENPVWLALAFFGALFVASEIFSLPFQWYSTFVIEEKFGFNKTDKKTFLLDKLKGILLAVIIGGLLVGILLYLIISIGPNFWIYFWLVVVAFMLFMNLFYTSLIVPLFNKLSPLQEGELKTAIEEYSQKVAFPITNVFVIDGSKRSTKANAFFSGLGKRKKVVLYDTLIENHSNEELLAVLAHEVGHYKKKHIITGLAAGILQTGITLFIMSLMIFSPKLSASLGGEQLAFHLNLIAFAILYSPISKLTGLIMNVVSRKNEFQADAYATHTYNGNALQNALKKLSVNNLSNLLPHPWYVFWHYSHPPLLKRLHAIDNEQSVI
jgi:STE24 endopeptidase